MRKGRKQGELQEFWLEEPEGCSCHLTKMGKTKAEQLSGERSVVQFGAC